MLRCDELTPPESASGTSDSKQYALTLKDSVLYPEGGGQVRGHSTARIVALLDFNGRNSLRLSANKTTIKKIT